MSAPNSSRSGAFLNTPCDLGRIDLTQPACPGLGELDGVGDAQLLLAFSRTAIVAGLDQTDGMFWLAVDGDGRGATRAARFGARWSRSPCGRPRCRAATPGASAGWRRCCPCGARPPRSSGGTGAPSTPYMRLTFCFSRSCRPKSDVREPEVRPCWPGLASNLRADRAAGALQEEVGAFAAGQFALGAEVACHWISLSQSDAMPSGVSRVRPAWVCSEKKPRRRWR